MLDLGDCDLEAEVRSGRLGRRLCAAIRPGVRYVCVDLHACAASGTLVVGVLVAAERRARETGTRLLVVASAPLLQSIRLCRLERVLPLL